MGSVVRTRNSRLDPGRLFCLCWHWASHPMFSFSNWFLKCFFSVLLVRSVGSPEACGSRRSLSLRLGEEPEARFGWLETPGLLWGQRELVQGVKDDETVFAPTASFGVCCHHHGGLSMDLISEQPLPTAPRAGQDAERSVSLPSKQHWRGGLGEM